MHVYHERQLGALCGVHCVNNLLQGPRFGPGDLAEIAIRLDEKERRLLGGKELEMGSSCNFDGSADGGNFSIQVLRIALARAGLNLLPAEHPDAKELMSNPAKAAAAFVVQRRDHWSAVRMVGWQWWDLDSLLECPKPLDDMQLESKLGRLLSGGHSIFLVLGGELPKPRPPPDTTLASQGDSNWHHASVLLAWTDPPSPSSPSAFSDPPEAFADNPLHSGGSLEGFADAEVNAALALAGGDPNIASDILQKARNSIAKYIGARPERLARALSSAVDAVLQAKRLLPEAVARLVALLCAPASNLLVKAAMLIDCGDLANRLLTALAKKARGWLWTDNLAQAATVAVDLLLGLSEVQVVPKSHEVTEGSIGSEADPQLCEEEIGDAMVQSLHENIVDETAADVAARQRDSEFEALDKLLNAVEAEGRLVSRPLLSEPGLRTAGKEQLSLSKKGELHSDKAIARNRGFQSTSARSPPTSRSAGHLWKRN